MYVNVVQLCCIAYNTPHMLNIFTSFENASIYNNMICCAFGVDFVKPNFVNSRHDFGYHKRVNRQPLDTDPLSLPNVNIMINMRRSTYTYNYIVCGVLSEPVRTVYTRGHRGTHTLDRAYRCECACPRAPKCTANAFHAVATPTTTIATTTGTTAAANLFGRR